jgi:hypothetical protein
MTRIRSRILSTLAACTLVAVAVSQGRASAPEGHYTLEDDGWVRDNRTGLVWEHPYQEGPYTWSNANQRCENRGYRAPTIKEALTLVDSAAPTGEWFDDAWFPSTKNDWFWTSSSAAGAPDTHGWALRFNGGTYQRPKTDLYPVRCVR